MRRLSLLKSDEFYQKSYAERLLGSIAEKAPLELLSAQPEAVTRNRLRQTPGHHSDAGSFRRGWLPPIGSCTVDSTAFGSRFRWLPLLSLSSRHHPNLE